MENIGFIYKITNPSGQVYIGATADLKSRLYNYSKISCVSQTKLHDSIIEFGWTHHVVEVIEQPNLSNLSSRESYWIKTFKSNYCRYPNSKGLNLSDGGKGPNGYKHTEGAKTKMKHRMQTNSHMLGRKMPDSTRSGIQNSLCGIYFNPSNGIYYTGIKEVQLVIKRDRTVLEKMFNGKSKNKTGLIKV
jgi:group I intron endonuclease